MRETDGPNYDERLSAPWWWWALLGAFALSVWLVVQAALGMLPGVATALALAGPFAAWLAVYGSARVRVADGVLEAGQARVPLWAVGGAYALDAREAWELRGPGADARAYLLLRSYIPTAVRVDVTDPDDPTPYLFVSTRHPGRLAAVIGESARS